MALKFYPSHRVSSNSQMPFPFHHTPKYQNLSPTLEFLFFPFPAAHPWQAPQGRRTLPRPLLLHRHRTAACEILDHPLSHAPSALRPRQAPQGRTPSPRPLPLHRCRTEEEVLMKEYEESVKSSIFVYQRIGEKDGSLEEFKKAVLRIHHECQVEHIIKEDNTIEAYDLIDIYYQLLATHRDIIVS